MICACVICILVLIVRYTTLSMLFTLFLITNHHSSSISAFAFALNQPTQSPARARPNWPNGPICYKLPCINRPHQSRIKCALWHSFASLLLTFSDLFRSCGPGPFMYKVFDQSTPTPFHSTLSYQNKRFVSYLVVIFSFAAQINSIPHFGHFIRVNHYFY